MKKLLIDLLLGTVLFGALYVGFYMLASYAYVH